MLLLAPDPLIVILSKDGSLGTVKRRRKTNWMGHRKTTTEISFLGFYSFWSRLLFVHVQKIHPQCINNCRSPPLPSRDISRVETFFLVKRSWWSDVSFRSV